MPTDNLCSHVSEILRHALHFVPQIKLIICMTIFVGPGNNLPGQNVRFIPRSLDQLVLGYAIDVSSSVLFDNEVWMLCWNGVWHV